jgi:hypothetical protein
MASTYDTPESPPPDKRPRGGYSAPPPEESPRKEATADLKQEYVASSGYGAGLRDYLRALPVYVDDLTREVDLHVYERMRWDECVAGSLDALVYQALADDIDFRPAVDDEDSQYYADSKAQADTLNRVMADMDRPLIEWAYEMVSDAIGGGNRVSEKVVRQEEGGPYSGLWVWDRLKVKPRRHLSFAMDTFNNLRGILTAIPGTYMGLDGSIPVDPKETPNLLPREKFALLSWNSHNDDPRGRPLLRRVYVPWWEKIQVAGEWLKHLSRFGSPSVVGTTAPNSDFVPPQDEFGNPLSGTSPGPEQALLNGLERLQNGGCLVLPYGATVTALQVAQSGEAFVQKIEQCDRAITRGTLLAIRAVMEAQHGSKADSQTAQDVTGLVVRYVKNWTARMITRDLVKPLVAWNKGADAARVICPYASLTPVEHQDWSQKATAVAALKTSGFLKPSQEPALAEEMGLPPATEPVEQPQPQPQQGQQPGQNGVAASGDKGLSPEAATFAEWEESKHPRGQPENKGQFGPGGGGVQHVGYISESEAKVQGSLPKNYEQSVEYRLTYLAEIFKDKLEDTAIEWDRDEKGEIDFRDLVVRMDQHTDKVADAAERAVKGRAALLVKRVTDEYGDDAKGLPSYGQFRHDVIQAAQKVLDAFSDAGRAVRSKFAEEGSDGVHEELDKSLPRLKELATTVGTDVTVGYYGWLDEVEAGRQAERGKFLTDAPNKVDAAHFPAEDEARTPHTGDYARAEDWEEHLPKELTPIRLFGPVSSRLKLPDGTPLTKGQQDAVAAYTNKHYENINHTLRSPEYNTMSRQELQTHKKLQGLFAKLPVSKEPVTVYRGLSLSNRQTLALLRRFKEAQASGGTIRFAGYSSTTFDPEIAFTYGSGGKLKERHKGGAGNDVVFEIAARKGLNIGELSNDDPTGQLSESELLLDHNSAFRVAAIRSVPFKHPETGKDEQRVVVQLVQEV